MEEKIDTSDDDKENIDSNTQPLNNIGIEEISNLEQTEPEKKINIYL